MRPLSSAVMVVAFGVLVVGCASSGVSTPRVVSSPAPGSPSASAQPAAPHTSPATRRTLTVTSALAPFKLPSAVSRPIVFSLGGGLLIVGGLTAADQTTPAILRVDLKSGSVKPTGLLAVPVHDAGGALVGGRDLVFGGGSTAVASAVQDVTPGSSPHLLSHLPQPRADHVAVSDGSAGYVLGGFDGIQGSTSILRTLDGRTFTVVGALPLSVRYPAVAVSGGSIWLFGGEHAGKQVSDVQRIDLATGRGSIAGHLPRPLAHAGTFTLGGVIFLAGGRSGDTQSDAVMRFDPATARFTAAGHLPGGRSDFGVAVDAGVAYLVGGESPKPVATIVEVRAQPGGTP